MELAADRICRPRFSSSRRGEERERERAVYSSGELYIAGSRHIILDPRRRLYIPLFPSSLFLPALAPERDCQVAGALPLFPRYFWLSLFDGWGPSDVATDSITTSVILRIRRIRFMLGDGYRWVQARRERNCLKDILKLDFLLSSQSAIILI